MPPIADVRTGSDKPGATDARNWSLYVAGFLGGIILAIGDLVTNDTSATVLKFQTVLQTYVSRDIENGGLAGLLFVGSLGAIFCWVWPVSSKGEAFVRGFSVFAIVTVGTPYKGADQQQRVRPQPTVPGPTGSALPFSFISTAYAANPIPTVSKIVTSTDAPIATVVVEHRGVSSCKPYYWGILGLGSFINNSVEICATGHVLPPGTKVKMLDCWDTGLRDYRYVSISYMWDGKQKLGWAMAGKGPRYWELIVPDNPTANDMPKNCR